MKKKLILLILTITIIIILFLLLVYIIYFRIEPKKYTNKDFNIKDYKSSIDKDNDGIDDQTDILLSVNEYIKTKPKYKSKYYSTGYPDDEYGVCTDVVANGLKGAGYDLMNLVNEDIINNRGNYNIETVDKNIDFRRVVNLKVYFKNNAISLSTDLNDIEEWQGGDIVIFYKHVAVISDKRNKKGIPYIIHNAYPMQVGYEQNVLESYKDQIVGHYRIS